MKLAVQFVLLDTKQHDCKNFDCGKPEMNLFLNRYADKNRKLGLSSTWILPEKLPPDEFKKASIGASYIGLNNGKEHAQNNLDNWEVRL